MVIWYSEYKHPIVNAISVQGYQCKCAVRRNASISAITCTPVIINVMTTAMVTYVNISTELIPSGYNLMKLKILNTVVNAMKKPMTH